MAVNDSIETNANKCTQEFVFITENHFKNLGFKVNTTIASTLLVLCVVSHINFVLVIGFLKDHYKRKRFRTAVDQWPPEQPDHFTPLVLIKHNDKLDKDVTLNQIKGNIDLYCDGISEDLKCIFSLVKATRTII